MQPGEPAKLLNTLLEAERAGAEVLRAFAAEMPLDDAGLAELRRVQRDEARNCQVLLGLLRRIGAQPSTATGDFVARALAVEGARERLEFLNRGQAWVARRLAEALPGIDHPEIRAALQKMHDSHAANIRACEGLIAQVGS